MKKLLSIALSLCLILSMLPMTVLAATFSDMPSSDHWSYAALQSAVENGLLNGNKGKLNPDQPLTRAQMAAIINRAFGAIDTADISSFSDVSPAAWYYTDIAKAVRMGTFTGSGDRMNPNAAITRQQAFTVLARAFRLEDGKAEDLAGFADAAKVSGYAVGPVAAMISAGYVNGKNGNICPTDTITREQFAQVIYNMLKTYISDAGTYTEDLSGNVMVNVPGVVLKDMTIDGDLIVGEGVGDGEVTLDGVNLTGRLVIRGGGENSIVIKNKSNVGSVVLSKTGDGGVRLHTEKDCNIDVVYIPDGKDDIILEGTFNQVDVATDAPVVLKSATVAGLTVSGENASVSTQGHTEITTVMVEEKAAGATLTVDGSSTIANLTSAAEGVAIEGNGTVTQAFISGNNTTVDTKGTAVSTGENVSGVTAGGQTVAPGTVSRPNTPPTPSNPSTPGNSDKPNDSSKPNNPSTSGEIEVNTLAELKAALKGSYKTIKTKSLIILENEALTIDKKQTLEIHRGLILTGKKASLTNNGTIINKTEQFEYVEVEPGTGWYKYENGEYVRVKDRDGNYNRRYVGEVAFGDSVACVEFSVNAGATLTNNGMLDNRRNMYIHDATFRNAGTFTQDKQYDGALHIAGTFENSGTVTNDGSIYSERYEPFVYQYDANKLYYGKSDKEAEPSVTIGGVFTNADSLDLAAGTAVITGILHNISTQTGTNSIRRGNITVRCDLTVEKKAVLNNYGRLNIYGSLVNNGTVNSGAANKGVVTDLWNSSIRGYSGEIINNGTWNNARSIQMGLYGDDSAAPSFVNYGTFHNGSDASEYSAQVRVESGSFANYGSFTNSVDAEEAYAYVHVDEGSFYNSGHFENFGSLLLYGADFVHEGDEKFENIGDLSLSDGSDLDLSKAGVGTFVHSGEIDIHDAYNLDGKGEICEFKLGENGAFLDKTNHSSIHCYAESYGQRGFEAAHAAQKERTDELSYLSLSMYGDIVIDKDTTKDTTLDAFSDYSLWGRYIWNSETQEEKYEPGTLTVNPGVTLTLQNCLNVYNGATVHNEGIITNPYNEESRTVLDLNHDGGYTGDGEVVGEFRLYFNELRDEETLESTDTDCSVIMLKDSSVSNTYLDSDRVDYYDVDILQQYGTNDPLVQVVQEVTFVHRGELSGSALTLENSYITTNAYTFLGLKGATLAEIKGKPLFDYIEIYPDDEEGLEIEEDLAIRNAYLNWQNHLTIPYGKTLTVTGSLYNNGNLHVDGTLIIESGVSMYNYRILETGALNGTENGQIIVRGHLYNGGKINIYKTGALIKEGVGVLDDWSDGVVNNFEGRNDFAD